MYALLPYFWLLFMLGLVVATIVFIVKNRPKKAPKAKDTGVAVGAVDSFGEPEPMLDFGDEFATTEKK
jgi:hypothetical protein